MEYIPHVALINDLNEQNEIIEHPVYDESSEFPVTTIDLSDPGYWPNLSDKLRILIVEKKPFHVDRNYNFPLNDERRSFEGKWFYKTIKNGEKIRRQWLIYSISKDAIYCFPCLLFSKKNKIRTSSFWDGGFSDWKHLNPRIKEHENSDYHSNCVNDWKEFEKRLEDGKTIDDELQQIIQNEKNKWRHILKIVTRIILFCSNNNLPLRGSSEKMFNQNCGIFLNLIELLSHYDTVLLDHIKSINSCSSKNKLSYFSPTIQNELIVLLGKKVKNEALDRIKRAKYFSILFDCMPDVSHKEQLTEIIRYVRIIDKEVTIEETFIDFIATQEKKGIRLAGEITKKLFDDGTNIKLSKYFKILSKHLKKFLAGDQTLLQYCSYILSQYCSSLFS
ncbi:unnamed protein product [Macrosiphum euphorbiae]|uniref:TTF-type domain-containing protein n=1 Tax=Macrosiphum euphorbiae TaxID=13131 RepID=A0AAV0YAC2_9HEMI|nr:unnamed protein product [Macrosiphum euphorbiae]